MCRYVYTVGMFSVGMCRYVCVQYTVGMCTYIHILDLWCEGDAVFLHCCRLRHVRTRENPQERGSYAAHYHSLRCYDINDLPPTPIPILDGNEN